MEFCEKLQALRKQKGWTQEELAGALFVSRTAVSKWESGRGYPSIDSLKAIATLFHLSVDELLNSEELLLLAKEDQKQSQSLFRDLVFGLLDLSHLLFLFLHCFAQRTQEEIREVSLLALTQVSPELKIALFALVFGTALFGILTLALQQWTHPLWQSYKNKISLILNIFGTLLFTLSLHPYAAVLSFVFLIIKWFLITKKG